jgi:hypothetical protein
MAKLLLLFGLIAVTSTLAGAGCGEEKKTVRCSPPGSAYQCFCAENQPGILYCQIDGTFTLCDCSGAPTTGGGGFADTTNAASVTEGQTQAPPTSGATTGAGGRVAATATKKNSCPDGYTCSLDALLQKAYVCNPPNPADLICTTKDDCKAKGLPDAECLRGDTFSACFKSCVP